MLVICHLTHHHSYRSVERSAGDFENELIHRSSIQLLHHRQMKFTKKKSRKQEKAQRKWELERKVDSSETASITSVASSGSSSTTASTAVDDATSVTGQKPAVKDVSDSGNTGEQADALYLTPTTTNRVQDADKSDPEAANATDGTQVTDLDAGGDKSKTPRSFTFGGHLGSDLPAYFFDWKQRLFGTDDKFKTDWPSTDLEAYIRHNPSFGKPTKVPFGHKRLHYGLNKVIKDGKKDKSTWNSYVDVEQVTRLAIDEIVEEANRHQSRERVCVAFQEYNKESDDPFLLVFLSLRKEPKPISFKDAVGRTYSLPFETCRKWEVSAPLPFGKPLVALAIIVKILTFVQAMKATIIEAFNHVEVIGPHVIEGHFDLSK